MFPICLFIHKVKPSFLVCSTPPPTPQLLSDSCLNVFFSGKKQMRRLFHWGVFYDCKCSSTWMLQQNAINSWDCCISLERKTWGAGGGGISSKMYCLTEQSEAVFVFFNYYYFPWSFWSALFMPFSTFTSSFPRLPWLRSRKQEWALFPDIQRNTEVWGNRVFCFASQPGFAELHWEGTCSQTGSGVTLQSI